MNKKNLETKGKSVMIVDDNVTNIDILRRILEAEGYDLSFAVSGGLAINLALHNKPDLILMDVMMPKLDGFETCQFLKKEEKTKDIPLIFITAKTSVGDIMTGFDLGCADYITKPFYTEEVVIRVRTHLQISMYQDSLEKAKEQLRKQNILLKETNEIKNIFIGMALNDIKDHSKFKKIISQLRGCHHKLKMSNESVTNLIS